MPKLQTATLANANPGEGPERMSKAMVSVLTTFLLSGQTFAQSAVDAHQYDGVAGWTLLVIAALCIGIWGIRHLGAAKRTPPSGSQQAVEGESPEAHLGFPSQAENEAAAHANSESIGSADLHQTRREPDPHEKNEASILYCRSCGSQIPKDSKFCQHCGTGVIEGEATDTRNGEPGGQGQPSPEWSPGVAAVLSLVIPGAGQIYRGNIGVGLMWLLGVVTGYMVFAVPGIILHLFCIFNAASGNDSRMSDESEQAEGQSK
jgi:TM2 domain-containing membrane protein YozV